MHRESRFAFRQHLAQRHPLRIRADALPQQADEILIRSDWKIIAEPPDDPVLRTAAEDLCDYFLNAMGIALNGDGSDPAKIIRIAVCGEENQLTSRITADSCGILISGATPREALQGCCRLEDEIDLRGLPAVKTGTRTHTRMFSPRMTHSGWGLDEFPDVYLARVAHAGMDAIVVFITEAPDVTRCGKTDINDLVQRAARWGLDVYFYPVMHCAMHPDDPGAEQYYDDLYGSLFRNAPGVKGIVFVGESCAFPSKDPHTYGFCWNRHERPPGETRPPNGFWPSTDFPQWLRAIQKTIRKYTDDFEIVFWSYNWKRAPEENRLALIRNLPPGITLHVTFEMGGEGSPGDYSIRTPGPSTVFISEAQEAKRCGVPLYAMTNTGGMTWDCGTVPYQPVPELWIERCQHIRAAKHNWDLSGLMESHHYGFYPGFVSDIVKVFLTEETQDEDPENVLRRTAELYFGREHTDTVLQVWKLWSKAYRDAHSISGHDQYCALRVGPVFPLRLPGDPAPPFPETVEKEIPGLPYFHGWCITNPAFEPPDFYLEVIEQELTEQKTELSILEEAQKILDDLKGNRELERLIAIGGYLTHTVRTMFNMKRFFLTGKHLDQDRNNCITELLRILDDEERNVLQTIPYVEADSRLGWEPTIGYITDKKCLEWKLDQLSIMRQRLIRMQERS